MSYFINRTDLPDDELEAILCNIPIPNKAADDPPPLAPPTSPSSGACDMVSSDKEMRKLLKKLEQIEKLKGKLATGQKLEKNQVTGVGNCRCKYGTFSVRHESVKLVVLYSTSTEVK